MDEVNAVSFNLALTHLMRTIIVKGFEIFDDKYDWK